jgi:3-phosphoglycerate kinase
MTALLPRVDAMIDGAEDGAEPKIAERCGNAGTILWVGGAELQAYGEVGGKESSRASRAAVLHDAMRRGVKTIICSEEDKRFGDLAPENVHVSSGPRAFLEYLERLSLPGITALDPSASEPAGPSARRR